jgi:eukaryotic-like serine/threonine-protein kinase
MLELHDLSRDGRELGTRLDQRGLIEGRAPGDSAQRDLSWFDLSQLMDITPDGRTILIGETSDGGGPDRAVYHRKTDGSPATRLGEGVPLALSQDGQWAVVPSVQRPQRLWLYPTGPGERRAINTGTLQTIRAVDWFPDSRRLLIDGLEAGRPSRLYRLALAGNRPPQAETPEGFGEDLISPEVLASRRYQEMLPSCGESGGERSAPAPGTMPGDVPIEWMIDGRSLYVFRRDELPARVFLVDLETGARKLWRAIDSGNGQGRIEAFPVN